MSVYATPATARVIGAGESPFSIEVDVSGNAAGTGQASSCQSTPYFPCWFAYTAIETDVFIALQADRTPEDATNYRPVASVFTGTPDALTQVTIDVQTFCEELTGGSWLLVPVTPGTTYYVQVVDQNNTTPIDASLVFQLQRGVRESAPAGSILIPDDADGFPAAIIGADGTFLNALRLPAGEFGDNLLDGRMCLQNGFSDHGIALVSAAGEITGTHDFGDTVNVLAIKSNRVDTFYVLTAESGARTIRALSPDGVFGDTWAVPAGSVNDGVFAVSRDGALWYSGQRSLANKAIHCYDLVNDIALSDLHAGFTGEALWGAGDGFVTEDGNIVFAYVTFGGGGTGGKVRVFAPDGSVLSTIVLAGHLGYLNHYAFANDGPPTIAVWGSAGISFNPGYVQFIDLDTGTVSETAPFEVIGTSGSADSAMAASNSCPMLILQHEIVPAPDPPGECIDGTIEADPDDLEATAGETVTLRVTLLPAAAAPTPDALTVDVVLEDDNDTIGTWVCRWYAGAPGDRSSALSDAFTLTDTHSVELTDFAADVDVWLDVTNTCAADVEHVTALESAGASITVNTDCECCMSTELNIINDALEKIGVTLIVQDGDTTSQEAILGYRASPRALKQLLRRHPWGFATKYAASADATVTGDPMELVGGTETVAVNGDWQYAYRYPLDCLKGRRIVPAGGQGRKYAGVPIAWRVGRTTEFGADDDYLLIFTNEADAVLEYTALVECREDFTDALFEDALSWLIASKLAAGLGQNKLSAAECVRLYDAAFHVAATVDMQEQQQEPDGEAAWIAGR